MSPQPLGVGLVGAGHHGLRYARHLLEGLPGAHLAALCRRRPEAPLGLDLPPSVPVYTDYHALVSDPAVQAVVAVVPPVLNPGICLAAAQAGKPVLIEKPLAITAAEARLMASATARAGVPLMTAQTMRFDPTVLALSAARAEVGPLRYLSLTSRIETKQHAPDHAAGYGNRGALLEIGVHLLDLVRFLTGDEVADLRCETDTLPPTPDTLATVTLRTTRGAPCFLDIARVAAGRVARLDWIGTHGQLSADWHRGTLTCITDRGPVPLPPIPPRPTIATTLTAFLTAIQTATPPPITGEDGLRAVELVDACYSSAERDGHRVSVRPPRA